MESLSDTWNVRTYGGVHRRLIVCILHSRVREYSLVLSYSRGNNTCVAKVAGGKVARRPTHRAKRFLERARARAQRAQGGVAPQSASALLSIRICLPFPPSAASVRSPARANPPSATGPPDTILALGNAHTSPFLPPRARRLLPRTTRKGRPRQRRPSTGYATQAGSADPPHIYIYISLLTTRRWRPSCPSAPPRPWALLPGAPRPGPGSDRAGGGRSRFRSRSRSRPALRRRPIGPSWPASSGTRSW